MILLHSCCRLKYAGICEDFLFPGAEFFLVVNLVSGGIWWLRDKRVVLYDILVGQRYVYGGVSKHSYLMRISVGMMSKSSQQLVSLALLTFYTYELLNHQV